MNGFNTKIEDIPSANICYLNKIQSFDFDIYCFFFLSLETFNSI